MGFIPQCQERWFQGLRGTGSSNLLLNSKRAVISGVELA